MIDELMSRNGDQEALRSWRCTYSAYRCLLAPYGFETIALNNSERSSSSVLALADSRRNEHVQILSYTGSATPWKEGAKRKIEMLSENIKQR